MNERNHKACLMFRHFEEVLSIVKGLRTMNVNRIVGGKS